MQVSYAVGPFLLPMGIKNKPFRAEFELTKLKGATQVEATRRITKIIVHQDANGNRRIDELKESEKNKLRSTTIYNHGSHKLHLLDAESKSVFTMPQSELPPDSELPASSESELPTFIGEDIGKKVIERLVCRGYRVERTENDILEYWVSEELSEVLEAKIILENEENILRVVNIERVEPSGGTFLIPGDYKMVKTE